VKATSGTVFLMRGGSRRLRALFIVLVALALLGVTGLVSSVARDVTAGVITYTSFTVVCVIAAAQTLRLLRAHRQEDDGDPK
jgi:hypothetical protein